MTGVESTLPSEQSSNEKAREEGNAEGDLPGPPPTPGADAPTTAVEMQAEDGVEDVVSQAIGARSENSVVGGETAEKGLKRKHVIGVETARTEGDDLTSSLGVKKVREAEVSRHIIDEALRCIIMLSLLTFGTRPTAD